MLEKMKAIHENRSQDMMKKREEMKTLIAKEQRKYEINSYRRANEKNEGNEKVNAS